MQSDWLGLIIVCGVVALLLATPGIGLCIRQWRNDREDRQARRKLDASRFDPSKAGQTGRRIINSKEQFLQEGGQPLTTEEIQIVKDWQKAAAREDTESESDDDHTVPRRAQRRDTAPPMLRV